MSTFEVTFLGHQGWLFAAGDSRLLVDPLLTPAMGHLGAIGEVYPPRVFSWDAFPPIDALLLTHEHEDHFDVPSLARIDRRVPVLLPAHSSRAAHALLVEMGFTVHRVRPGDEATIGDLSLRLFAPDFTGRESSDEWDVVPFLVTDRRGHGSFFSAVDVAVHDRLEASLRAATEKPSIWCYTNNAADYSFTEGGQVIATEPTDSAALALIDLGHYAGLCFRWAQPEVVLMCGGGFAFSGARAWMNDHVFRASSRDVCAALGALSPGRAFVAPAPGQAVRLQEGKLAEIRETSPFLKCAAPDEWPRRRYLGEAPLLETYASFCGNRSLDAAELADLHRELDAFAAHLCSRKMFRELLSLERAELEGRKPTFVIVALHDEDGSAYTFEYDLAACAFARVSDVDPVAGYVGGIECWATDLLAVLRCELAPSAISFGRCRTWNAMPERCEVGTKELSLYSHPLRRPDAFSRFYRRMLANVGNVGGSVRSARDSRLAVRGSS